MRRLMRQGIGNSNAPLSRLQSRSQIPASGAPYLLHLLCDCARHVRGFFLETEKYKIIEKIEAARV